MRYFSEKDFYQANPSCVYADMSDELIEMLDVARFYSGTAYVINSAYRTLGWELQQGRDGTSSHTKGLAVDIRVQNNTERFQILKGLVLAGFERIGIGKDFIHVDIDPDKPAEVAWLYE